MRLGGKRNPKCTLARREASASGNFLKRFDTDGSPIIIGQTTKTSKGTVPKEYQTPYGATTVSRHVYQSSRVREDVGVADGAKTNWPILTKQTERQILDFYHAAEYLTQVADAQESS